MTDQRTFLEMYNINQEAFEKSAISWYELEKIYDHYMEIEPKLKVIGKEFVDQYLYDTERIGIHSYRYRAKDQGHLIEKIIRKRIHNFEKYKNINSDNYYKFITESDRDPRVLFVSGRLEDVSSVHYHHIQERSGSLY